MISMSLLDVTGLLGVGAFAALGVGAFRKKLRPTFLRRKLTRKVSCRNFAVSSSSDADCADRSNRISKKDVA